MKIHVICQYFPPEIGAPQARIFELASFWQQEGHSVTVLTAMPNHPTGVIPLEYRGKLFCEEVMHSIRVWRHWIFATPNEGFIKKTCSHLSFMLSVLILSLWRQDRPDIYMVSSPSFFSVLSAFVFSKIRRTPYIFEVRDLWPGIFVELGVLKNKYLIGVLEKIELFLYKHSSHVVVVSHGFKDDLVKRGVLAEKISVIPNGVNLDFFASRDLEQKEVLRERWHLPREKFILIYTGAIGISHGLDVILQVAAHLKHQSDILFLMVGEGAEKKKLITLAEEMALPNVLFMGGQQREKIPSLILAADVCLVSLKDIAGFASFIPSKMFEFMAMSKPILGIVSGEAESILRASHAALVAHPGDVLEIKKAVETFCHMLKEELQNMGGQGFEFVKETYDRKKQARQYASLMTVVAGTQ